METRVILKVNISSEYLWNVHMSGGITSSFIGALRSLEMGEGRLHRGNGVESCTTEIQDTGKIEQVCGSNVQTVYCNITHATVAEDFVKPKLSHRIWALSDFWHANFNQSQEQHLLLPKTAG